MTVGESNEKPSSPRIPCNHTHCVAAFTAPLYYASTEERDIVTGVSYFTIIWDHVKA